MHATTGVRSGYFNNKTSSQIIESWINTGCRLIGASPSTTPFLLPLPSANKQQSSSSPSKPKARSKMLPNKSTNQCDYPKTTLALSYLLLAIWLVIGMFTFHFIESPNEDDDQSSSDTLVLESLIIEATDEQESPFSRPLVENVNIISVRVFTNETSTYSNVTFTRVKSGPQLDPARTAAKWDLPGSLFFSMTVVTTIGYGNLAPVTILGKSCCVIYALIGIPLCFNVVGLIRKWAIRFLAKMHAQLTLFFNYLRLQKNGLLLATILLLKTPKKDSETSAPENSVESDRKLKRKAWIATIIVALVLYYAFVLSSSGLIHFVEGWSFVSSLYYTFITLTTIGFGDLIAGQNRPLFRRYWMFGSYRLFLSCYIFCGMAFASLLIHEMEKITERLINRLVCLMCHKTSTTSKNGDVDVKEVKNCRNQDKIIASNNQNNQSMKGLPLNIGSNGQIIKVLVDGEQVFGEDEEAPNLSTPGEPLILRKKLTKNDHDQKTDDISECAPTEL